MNTAQIITLIILSIITALISVPCFNKDVDTRVPGFCGLFLVGLIGWFFIGVGVNFNEVTTEESYEVFHTPKSVGIVDDQGNILYNSKLNVDVERFKNEKTAKVKKTFKLNLYNCIQDPTPKYDFVR